MASIRSGSAILLCMALATMAVMVGYAFLRAATRQTMSGKSELLIALAREAAQSGLSHATEQILTDYNAPSLDIASGTGKIPYPAAPTFLDGPFRAPFVSLRSPGRILYTMGGNAPTDDDASESNHLLLPIMRKSEQGYSWWQEFDTRGVNGGNSIYDARGRYIEVNYHNVTRPDPTAVNPVPVTTLRFTDLAAAVPERSDGIFLDEGLRRLSSGSVQKQRQDARYRLRYVVGVEDLSGHFLSNPRAKMNIDWKDPNNDYRVIPPWLDYAGYAWQNMMSMWAPTRATSLRLDHMLRGRGNASNADRDSTPGTPSGRPVTFPLMFRQKLFTSWDGMHGWFGNFNHDNNNNTPYMGGTLYSCPGDGTWEKVDPTIAGGKLLTPAGQSMWAPYAHALVGPQYSWFNQTFALQGVLTNVGQAGDERFDGWWRDHNNITSNSIILNTLTTPFGRRVEFNPTGGKWYQGKVDTPWQINLLTAPPQVFNEMLLGYIPPHMKSVHYTELRYYKMIGETHSGYQNADVTYTFDQNDDPSMRQSIDKSYQMPGLDLVTDALGSGFSEFPAPSSINAFDGTTVKPDYYQDPPDSRPMSQRYPGCLARGDSNKPNEGSDDLGEFIDADSGYGQGMSVGWCTHTFNPLMYQGGGDISWWDAKPPKYLVVQKIDPLQFTFRYSYYYDLIRAMTIALSYARATWVQYPNTVFDPKLGFAPATLRDPTSCDTIEKFDALFLRQLGESLTAPGTRNPSNPIVSKYISFGWPVVTLIQFSVNGLPVSNTIATLVAGKRIATPGGVSAEERGKVMERMLNDFRMSFFGSSPKYVDFRPLDFDGDGHVACSCYPINPAATADELKYATAHWMPAVGNGQGPKPADNMFFSITGCLSIGKSHFYRIWSRGEVYDNLLKKPVSQQTLESVLTVDPEAPLVPAPGRVSPENRLLYKHWLYNDICSELPLQTR